MTKTLDGLCEMYRDTKTGVNRCKELHENRRCGVGGMHETIIAALSISPGSAAADDAAHTLCNCSCWADIVDVYVPIFDQVILQHPNYRVPLIHRER